MFQKIIPEFDINQLVLKKIITNVFPEDSVSKVQMTYVIAVYVTILNSKCKKIKLNKRNER